MKIKIIFALSIMLISTGCYSKQGKDSTTINNQDKSTISTSDTINQRDGVIEEMSAKELVKTLSKLNEHTTREDLVKIFGKEPYMPIEMNSDIYDYFSGDIHIRLCGNPLYQATVTYDEEILVIDLQINEDIP